MKLRVTPPRGLRLRGELRVPSDKSITQRALILGALAEGTTRVVAPLDAGDTRSVRRALERLGVRVEGSGEALLVHGPLLPSTSLVALDLQNSGTGARLLLGALAGRGVAARLTGDESLRRRPMGRVVRPLQSMGARFAGASLERLPLTVTSTPPLAPFRGALAVASAQVKSAVLLAALSAEGESELLERVPTRAHTESLLPLFGGTLAMRPTDGGGIAIVLRGPQRLHGVEIVVPADPSSAAFHAAAAALLPGSAITFTDLLLAPRRTAFFALLERMGAVCRRQVESDRFEPVGRLEVASGELRATTIAVDEIPDLIDELPLVALVAALADGRTEVRGAAELRLKESDRITAIGDGLTRMGARFAELPDGFAIDGCQRLRGATVDSHADHRIAMALTVAALHADGVTTIDRFEAAAISYPSFLDDLRRLLGSDPFTCFD